MLISVIYIIFGFVLLIIGADMLVDGASGVAKKFHIPEIIIGLTIVSIGTSMPELFVSITSAVDGYSDMALGNVIGSNLSNLLLILGVSSMIKPIVFQKETRWYEIPMCLFFTAVLWLFCNTEHGISRLEGGMLLILFVLFIAYTFFMAMHNHDTQKEEIKQNSLIKNILWIGIGIVGLKFGGDLTVDHAVVVAQQLHLSEKIISLTILAIGTSLPELVTSVTAAMKGNSDIAIGNIIGSNIFNLLLIIGTATVIKPITYNVSYNFDFLLLLISTFILAVFPLIRPKNEMSRSNGVIYVCMYIGYLFFMFLH